MDIGKKVPPGRIWARPNRPEVEAEEYEERARQMESRVGVIAAKALLEDVIKPCSQPVITVSRSMVVRIWAVIQSKVFDRPEDKRRLDQTSGGQPLSRSTMPVTKDISSEN